MKARTTIILFAFGILPSGAPALRCADTKPEVMISNAASALMGSQASQDAILKALNEILDASLMIMPETEDSGEFRSRVGIAKQMFEERGLFNLKSRQYLGFAYRLVTAGLAWKVPDELSPAYRQKDIMEQAQRICKKLVDSALTEYKAGRNEEAVRDLVGFVLMVITPIEAIGT